MTIAEQIRQIMDSKELSDSEKRDRLRALIPADACKIDNLNKATPAQLKQLQEALAISQAMQEISAALLKASSPQSLDIRHPSTA
jgi:ribonuclease HII